MSCTINQDEWSWALKIALWLFIHFRNFTVRILQQLDSQICQYSIEFGPSLLQNFSETFLFLYFFPTFCLYHSESSLLALGRYITIFSCLLGYHLFQLSVSWLTPSHFLLLSPKKRTQSCTGLSWMKYRPPLFVPEWDLLICSFRKWWWSH